MYEWNFAPVLAESGFLLAGFTTIVVLAFGGSMIDIMTTAPGVRDYSAMNLLIMAKGAYFIADTNVTADPTCFKFQGISGATCVQGGKYCAAGVYRSASTCLMRTNTGAACPACAREIDDVLRERRSRMDWAPPWVATTAPAAGQGGREEQGSDDG